VLFERLILRQRDVLLLYLLWMNCNFKSGILGVLALGV